MRITQEKCKLSHIKCWFQLQDDTIRLLNQWPVVLIKGS
jgi:hypothetical protein